MPGRGETSRTVERRAGPRKAAEQHKANTDRPCLPEHKRPGRETLQPNNNPPSGCGKAVGPRKSEQGCGETCRAVERRAGPCKSEPDCGKASRQRRDEPGRGETSRAVERRAEPRKANADRPCLPEHKRPGGRRSSPIITHRRVVEKRSGRGKASRAAERRAGPWRDVPGRAKASPTAERRAGSGETSRAVERRAGPWRGEPSRAKQTPIARVCRNIKDRAGDASA